MHQICFEITKYQKKIEYHTYFQLLVQNAAIFQMRYPAKNILFEINSEVPYL